MQVSPTPWLQLTLTEVNENRNPNCPLYEECLFLAAKLQWLGFTCRYCSLFKKKFKESPLMGFWKGDEKFEEKTKKRN